MESIPGHVFHKFRTNEALSQAAAGVKLGVDRAAVHRLENSATIKPKYMKRIAAKFGAEWFKPHLSSKMSDEMKLLRHIDLKLDDALARLAEIEEANGIKHVKPTRQNINRLQN